MTVAKRAAEEPRLACYCFSIPEAEVGEDTVAWVKAQLEDGLCSCRTLNPSGKCCLPTLKGLASSAKEASG